MDNTLKDQTKRLFPVSALIWIGAEGEYDVPAKAENEFLQSFFPQLKLERLEMMGVDEKIIAKKVVLQYKRWTEDQKIEQLGLFCKRPVGFESWNIFMDFLRKDPPSFLWKIHPEKHFETTKILVPVDFSSGTERALAFLSKIINEVGEKEITLLNLYEPEDKIVSAEEIAASKKDKLEEMEWFLEANIPQSIRRKLLLAAQPRLGKDTTGLLDNYIKSNNIDLVILGSHNFNHYHYLLYGSTATEVLSTNSPVQVCVLFK